MDEGSMYVYALMFWSMFAPVLEGQKPPRQVTKIHTHTHKHRHHRCMHLIYTPKL